MDMLVPNQCVNFDNRLPTVLLGDLELIPNGRNDIFSETLYTATIWQVIRKQGVANRADVGLN